MARDAVVRIIGLAGQALRLHSQLSSNVRPQMEPFSQLLTVAVLAGIFNGLAFLRSNWELNARHGGNGTASGAGTGIGGQIAKQLLQGLVGVAAFLGLPLLPLSALGLLPLQGANLRWFFAAYLAAIGVGKVLRYIYWKRKLGGSFA